MFIVLVHVRVIETAVEAFLKASLENADASRQEPGIVRFDIIQEENDPTRFVLIEIYRSEQDPARHKQTAHYLKWRETVASMMADDRRGIRYRIISPPEDSWG